MKKRDTTARISSLQIVEKYNPFLQDRYTYIPNSEGLKVVGGLKVYYRIAKSQKAI